MLKSEFTTRRGISFATSSLKYFSIASIINACLFSVFYALVNIPGVCLFGGFFVGGCGVASFLFIGFYQLSRLEYCFSKYSVYSSKINGYSKYLFVFMYLWGTLIINIGFIFQMISQSGASLPRFASKCEYDSSFNIYLYPIQLVHVPTEIEQIWYLLSLASLNIWDLCTLRRLNTASAQKVMVVLYKIIVLTMFYQMTLAYFYITLFLSGSYANAEALWRYPLRVFLA